VVVGKLYSRRRLLRRTRNTASATNRLLAAQTERWTPRPEALEWVEGKEFWVPYDGTVPTVTDLRPDAHRAVVSSDPTFAANTSESALSGRTVTNAAAGNDRTVRHAQSQAGVSAHQTVGAGDLLQRIETEKTAVTEKTTTGAVDVTKARRENVEQLKDARDNVSPFHRLGDQIDERSAREQLENSKDHQSGGSSGDW
jgi:hypothetical protein